MTLVTLRSQCEPNHSVDAFTAHGIVDRYIQAALDGHMAEVYPASRQVIETQVMGPPCRLPFHGSQHVALSSSWSWN